MNLVHDPVKSLKYEGQLLQAIDLLKYNTWHVGGKADYVYKPKNLADLSNFLQQWSQVKPDMPIHWLGLGSNVLIRDGGLRGLVILTNVSKDEGLNGLDVVGENLLRVEAGLSCAKLAKYLADHDCPDGAFWAGIPGTMGGALAMNAGCYGKETWDFVKQVEVITRAGQIIQLQPKDFAISYRSTKYQGQNGLQEFWFVSGLIDLKIDKSKDGRQEIKNLLQKRSNSQPIGQFSGGSVFKNPQGDYAARLIEAANLKGFTIGGAMVSTKHANFIVNDKTATAENIEQLILYVQRSILEKFNIHLEPEVRIMGEL